VTYAAPALAALLGTFALMVVLRPVAVHLQLTDRPDWRKHHTGEVPLVGGIAIFVGILLMVGAGCISILAGKMDCCAG